MGALKIVIRTNNEMHGCIILIGFKSKLVSSAYSLLRQTPASLAFRSSASRHRDAFIIISFRSFAFIIYILRQASLHYILRIIFFRDITIDTKGAATNRAPHPTSPPKHQVLL